MEYKPPVAALVTLQHEVQVKVMITGLIPISKGLCD